MTDNLPYPLQRPIAGQFAVFGVIGLASTFIHVGTVIMLVEKGWASPILANGVAFFLANGFSYIANSRLNFAMAATPRRYLQFLCIALLGLSLTASLATAAEWLGWHYLAGMALVVGLVPALSFWLQRRFTFGQRPAPT